MDPEQMDRVIDEHFGYEAANDLDGVMSTFTDDAELDLVGLPGGPMRGKEQIRGFYEGLFKLLDQEDVQTLRRYYGQAMMVDETLWTGRFADGALFGAEGYAGRVSFRLLHVLEFRNDLIARENLWLDSQAAREQLLSGDR
jgi:ketosteroid isomerase-like protein